MENHKTTQLQGGLDKSYSEIHSKKGTASFALNAVRDSSTGDAFGYSSEPGTEPCITFERENQVIVGHIYGDNNTNYIFSTDVNAGYSEIGELKDCNYTKILGVDCLLFGRCNAVTGEYRIVRGCNRVLYFNDGINPDRRIDLDNLNDYKIFHTEDCSVFSWDCNQFNFNPDTEPICINNIKVNNSGGDLPLGSYRFSADVLDEDLNFIYRTDITLPVNIYDDNTNDDYNQIDGGFNLTQSLSATGGLPNTNKSIDLCFDNLPTEYSFLRINVIRSITGDGVTTDAHTIGNLLTINDSTQCFTYDGFNTTRGDTLIDYSGLLIKPLNYQSSSVMEQVQGRLLRANLKESVTDYSQFQSFASQICILPDYIRRDEDSVTQGNPKFPTPEVSYMPDEVYALGVVYILSDGSETPVFHIPGRAPVSTDLSIIPNSHSSNPYDTDQPFFKIFNTGTEDTMGYYECPTKYQEPDKCCVDDYWGTDCNNNSLSETPIRHHRMPDVPHCGNIYNLGIRATNIIYPPNVIGHYIVRANRTESDKTVVDQGILGGLDSRNREINKVDYRLTAFGLGTRREDNTTNHAWLWTPRMAYYDQNTSDCFIKLNQLHSVQSFSSDLDCVKINKTRFGDGKVDTFFISDIQNFTECTTLPQQNLIPTHTHMMDPGTVYDLNTTDPIYNTQLGGTDQKRVVNLSLDNRYQHLMLPHTVNFPRYTVYSVSVKSCRDVYCNLNNLTYIKTHNCVLTENENPRIFGGDVYHSEAKFTDSKISRFSDNIESDLLQSMFVYLATIVSVLLTVATAGAAAPLSAIIIAGAIGITTNLLAGIIEFYANRVYQDFTYPQHYKDCRNNARTKVLGFGVQTDDSMSIATQLFKGINLYSEINTSLRHSGTELCTQYYRGCDSTTLTNWQTTRFLEAQEDSDGDTFNSINLTCPQYYLYNRDYSKFNGDTPYFPINTITYDFCSDCQGEYPNRIIYSPPSESERLQDRYLVTTATDYIDLPAHRGAITGLKYVNNRLLVHTEQTTFLLQPNPQQLATNGTNINITTGDFLGIPEVEIRQTDLGYGGSQSRIAYSLNEYGYFWVDQANGEIFQYHSQLNEISKTGLDQWFKENLPQSPINNTCDGISCTTNGVHIVYDNRYERLLITKRDKQQCKSWTVSYSFKYQSWTSWHSYTPYYYFNDRDYFYSASCCGTVSKHLHECNYTTYYNHKYPFVIEWVQPLDYKTEDLQTIHYVAQAKIYNKEHQKWIPSKLTFNKAVISTDCETTGLQTLEYIDQQESPYQNVLIDSDIMTVTPVDDHFKICGIYDFATDPLVCSSDCDLLQAEDCGFYSDCSGYLDEVPINYEVPDNHYNYKQLDGKFFKTRLIYVPNQEDVKQFFYLNIQNTLPSMR